MRAPQISIEVARGEKVSLEPCDRFSLAIFSEWNNEENLKRVIEHCMKQKQVGQLFVGLASKASSYEKALLRLTDLKASLGEQERLIVGLDMGAKTARSFGFAYNLEAIQVAVLDPSNEVEERISSKNIQRLTEFLDSMSVLH